MEIFKIHRKIQKLFLEDVICISGNFHLSQKSMPRKSFSISAIMFSLCYTRFLLYQERQFLLHKIISYPIPRIHFQQQEIISTLVYTSDQITSIGICRIWCPQPRSASMTSQSFVRCPHQTSQKFVSPPQFEHLISCPKLECVVSLPNNS